jgi:hypothetical protein
MLGRGRGEEAMTATVEQSTANTENTGRADRYLVSVQERRAQGEHAAAMVGDMDSGMLGAVDADP